MYEVQPEIESLCNMIKSRGFTRVILLGSPAQMSGPAFRKPLAASGVLVLVPGEMDRLRIGDAINEMERGSLKPQTETWLRDMLEHGKSHGAEAIVVVQDTLCTELETWDLGIPLILKAFT